MRGCVITIFPSQTYNQLNLSLSLKVGCRLSEEENDDERVLRISGERCEAPRIEMSAKKHMVMINMAVTDNYGIEN